MCFCEENECNMALPNTQSTSGQLMLFLLQMTSLLIEVRGKTNLLLSLSSKLFFCMKSKMGLLIDSLLAYCCRVTITWLFIASFGFQSIKNVFSWLNIAWLQNHQNGLFGQKQAFNLNIWLFSNLEIWSLCLNVYIQKSLCYTIECDTSIIHYFLASMAMISLCVKACISRKSC